MQSMRELCAAHDMELIGTIPHDDCRAGRPDRALLEAADLVLVNGEGNLHHDHRADLLRIAKEFPCALINTVFEKNTRHLEFLPDFLYVSARESCSVAALADAGYAADLVPDVILCSPPLMKSRSRRGRTDVIVDHFSGVVTLQDYQLVVPEIQSAKTVRTGSFHAALVAIMFGKRVAVWSSSSHKMEGLAIDAGITAKPIKQNVMPDDCAKATKREYVERGQATINHMFEHLTTLA
jgi:hypothetical protein